MKPLGYITLPVVLLLPACAGPALTSTLPATPVVWTQPSAVGEKIPALLPGTAGAVAAQQKAEFERRLQSTGIKVELSLLPGDALGLRVSAADTFESGSAQLKARALTGYTEIAEVLKAFPGSVAHVLVYDDRNAGASGEPGEVGLSLGARRAASISDYLARRGIPLTRLRAEGRRDAEQRARMELVLKPVVQGQEALAWTAPP